MRYYVDNSSYFDNHPYRTLTIASAVRAGGGVNVRKSNKYGWRNQPAVVTFTSSPAKLKAIERNVEMAVGTKWIVIKEKNW